jgi:hypothetical protein
MLVSVAEARANHGIDDDYPEEPITLKLMAAEQFAQSFLNRRIYADDAALAAARALVPDAILAAGVAWEAAVDAADLIEDEIAAEMAHTFAESDYTAALTTARETFAGIVVNEQIKAAILLIFGHLFENHEDVVMGQAQAIPMGSQYLLQPYRVGMGV